MKVCVQTPFELGIIRITISRRLTFISWFEMVNKFSRVRFRIWASPFLVILGTFFNVKITDVCPDVTTFTKIVVRWLTWVKEWWHGKKKRYSVLWLHHLCWRYRNIINICIHSIYYFAQDFICQYDNFQHEHTDFTPFVYAKGVSSMDNVHHRASNCGFNDTQDVYVWGHQISGVIKF